MPTNDAYLDFHVRTFRAMQQLQAMSDKISELGYSAGINAKTASDSFDGMAKSAGGFGSKLKAAEPTIGKVATGVSGLSGALAGATGQTNALTGAVANMAGAFAGGGLLAVGVAGAVTGFGYLVEKMGKAREEAKKVEQEFATLADSFGVAGTDAANAAVDALQSRIAALTTGEADPTTGWVRQAKANLRSLEEQYEVGAKRRIYLESQLTGSRGKRAMALQEELDALNDWLPTMEQAALAQERELNNLPQIIREYKSLSSTLKTLEDQKEREKKDEERAADRKRERAAEEADARAAELRDLNEKIALAKEEQALRDEDFQRALQEDELRLKADRAFNDAASKQYIKAVDERERKDERARKKRERDEKRAADKVAAYKKKKAEEEQRDYEALVQERVALAEGFAQTAVGGMNSLMQAVITGQQDSIGQLLAAQITSLGTQIQGVGVKYFFEGIGMNAIAPGSGVAAMAAGAAAFAAGTAMGGTGMALGHIAQGGTPGVALPDGTSSTSSRGVGAVSRTTTAAPMTEATSTTTVYNFNGPTFDRNQSASAIVALARRSEERLLEAER